MAADQGKNVEKGDPSHALDLVTVFKVANTQSSFEAHGVRALLEAGGIHAELIGDERLPNLAYEVRVAQSDAERALSLIAEARALGPEAAAEAERESETP
jgi:hypothetical protein